MQVLRSALRQAERWGWILDNPASKADIARPKRVERGVLTDDEVFAVFDAAAELHEMAPIALRLAAVTGARRSELAALRWSAVDGPEIVFDRQVVVDREHPDAERGKPVLVEDATKTGARRRVTVDEETARLLAEARAGREEFAPWLFSDTDSPPNPDRIGWWWKRARDDSGIDSAWRLHDLRHWSATQAIAAGYDVQTVARRLGHSDATTTLRVYSDAIDRSDPALGGELRRNRRRVHMAKERPSRRTVPRSGRRARGRGRRRPGLAVRDHRSNGPHANTVCARRPPDRAGGRAMDARFHRPCGARAGSS